MAAPKSPGITFTEPGQSFNNYEATASRLDRRQKNTVKPVKQTPRNLAAPCATAQLSACGGDAVITDPQSPASSPGHRDGTNDCGRV